MKWVRGGYCVCGACSYNYLPRNECSMILLYLLIINTFIFSDTITLTYVNIKHIYVMCIAIYLFVSNDIMYIMFTFSICMWCVYMLLMLAHTCMLMNRWYMWEFVCLTVDLIIFLIIYLSSLHLLIYSDCCVSMDPLRFTLLHLEVMLTSSASF